VLRSIREQQGLTQLDVALALGKQAGTYAAYEAGRSRFTLPELTSVAEALRVSTPYLATRLGFCGGEVQPFAETIMQRFGPKVGGAVLAIDRVAALIEQDDAAALDVVLRRFALPYENRA